MTRGRPRASAALCALAAALALAPPPSKAQDARLSDAAAKRLFNGFGCNGCHATDELRIGPPYRAVALRYADASSASVERLALKIVAGGAGAWGAVPMVSNPRLSPADASALARWILALEPLERASATRGAE